MYKPWNSRFSVLLWSGTCGKAQCRIETSALFVIFNKRVLWGNVSSSARLYAEIWFSFVIQTVHWHTQKHIVVWANTSIHTQKVEGNSISHSSTHTELYIGVIFIYRPLCCPTAYWWTLSLLYDLPCRHKATYSHKLQWWLSSIPDPIGLPWWWI